MTEPDEATLWARDHELRSLLAAASPGPWHHVNAGKVSRKTRTVHGTVPSEPIDYVSTWPGIGTPSGHRVIVGRETGVRTADLALIAEAPALASEVLNLRAGQAASAERIKALEEALRDVILDYDWVQGGAGDRDWNVLDNTIIRARDLLKEADQ